MSTAFPSPLIGRDPEHDRLQAGLHLAAGGRGQLMLVSGEAGIGKTTLLQRIGDEASQHGFLCLTGGCYDPASDPPYGAWLEAFEYLPTHDDLTPPALTNREQSAAERVGGPHSLHREVREFLRQLSIRTPVLLLLEDLHWADQPTLDLLRLIGRQVSNLSLMIVGSYREPLHSDSSLYKALPDLVRDSRAERLILRRLVMSEVQELVRHQYELEDSDARRLARHVWSLTDGNPLFAREYLLSLETERILERRDGAWLLHALRAQPIPPLVQQLILGRLVDVPHDVVRAIQLAAVVGDEVELDVWEALLGEAATLSAAIESARRLDILRERPSNPGKLVFNHALTREAIYGAIPLTERREMHARIAAYLAKQPHSEPAMLARHFELSGQGPVAVDWLLEAARRAAALYAHGAVIALLTRAIQLSDVPILEAHRQRGLAHHLHGNFDAAREDLLRALQLGRAGQDQLSEWHVLLDLGELWSERDYREAGIYYQQALELARESSNPQRIGHSLNRIGNWLVNTGLPRAALQHHTEALELFESEHDDAGRAATLDLLAMTYFLHGDYQSATDHGRQAARLYREHQDHLGLAMSLAGLVFGSGCYDTDTIPPADVPLQESVRCGEEAIKIAQETGWRSAEATALIHLGYVYGLPGRFDLALDYCRRGLELALEIEHQQWILAGHFNLGVLLADLLDVAAALEHLHSALSIARSLNSHYWLHASIAAVAAAERARGNIEVAADILGQMDDQELEEGSFGLRQCWLQRAELALERGDPETAIAIGERLISTAPAGRSNAAPQLTRLLGRSAAAAGDVPQAERLLNQSLARARQLGWQSLGWRIEIDLGKLVLQSDAPAARRYFGSAQQHIDTIAQTIHDSTLRRTFRQRALEIVPVPAAASTRPFGLTARERQVLDLVVEGLTDAKIGERLYISPRTVGRHLQSIYQKLGVNSRAAATAMAFEHGFIKPSTFTHIVDG